VCSSDLIAGGLIFTAPVVAHKAITSRFTYNADVYPVFAARCSHCHVGGGVAPMSLVSYEDAFPWAESLRTELLDAGTTNGSGGDFIKDAHRGLTARELDVVLDWAVGGTPEGDGAKPSAPSLKNDWAQNKPDLVLEPPAKYDLAADTMEATHEFVLPVTLDAARLVDAVDVLPGTPAIVREVTLSVQSADGRRTPLGTWTPRQNPAPVAVHSGTSIGPAMKIVAGIHYKKTWKYEGQPMTDQSRVGIYFSQR